MTFYEWLIKQEGKDTLAGAMADDLHEYKDAYIVKDLNRLDWLKYLIDEKSCKTVIKAFEIIWNDFEKEQIEDEAIKKMEEEILNREIPIKHEEEIVPEKLEEEPLEYDENAVKDMFDIVKEEEENPTAPPFPPAIRKIKEGEQPKKTNVEAVQEEQKKSKDTNNLGKYTNFLGSKSKLFSKILLNKLRK